MLGVGLAPAALDTSQEGVDIIEKENDAPAPTADAIKPLLDRVQTFMSLVDKVAEVRTRVLVVHYLFHFAQVHPYAKAAWAVLSSAYKACYCHYRKMAIVITDNIVTLDCKFTEGTGR
jgi:hypothetical protein